MYLAISRKPRSKKRNKTARLRAKIEAKYRRRVNRGKRVRVSSRIRAK